MFVILITYKKPLEIVDNYLAEHIAFLDDCYRNNFFMASGPKNPRTGGVIISQLKQRDQLEDILKKDPFSVNNVANYEIIEFNPTKYHANFVSFIESA